MEKQYQPILIIKVINNLTLQPAAIQRFQAEKFVFVVKTENYRHKIFQVVFGKSDGSLYINFPYFDIKNGIVSTGVVPPLALSSKIDLTEAGKVTSNSVKYTHHPDGEVHFSQTGKVRTIVRKRSLPLSHSEGHLFSLHIQGLPHYEQDIYRADPPPKMSRTVLSFSYDQGQPRAIKFAGWWYQANSLIGKNQGGFYGPKVQAQTPDGRIRSTFMIGPPQGWPMDKHVFMVTCEETDVLDKNEEATLFFIGGFDGMGQIRDLSKPATFLCASYPASNYAELAERIGTIDIDQT